MPEPGYYTITDHIFSRRSQNPIFKFAQNHISNSWDIVDIEFMWWVWRMVHTHFIVKLNIGYVRLSWGFDNSLDPVILVLKDDP